MNLFCMRNLTLMLLIGLTCPAGAQGPPPAKVVVAEVFQKEVAPTQAMIGAIDFERQSGLSPEVSGLIQEHSIAEGGIVAKGDVLLRLNTDFIEKDLQILRKQIARIDVKLQNSRKNVKRYENLFKGNATSEKTYEDLVDGLREMVIEKEVLLKSVEKRKLEIAKSRLRAPFDGLVLEQLRDLGEWVSPGTPVCHLASIEDVVVVVAVPETYIRYVQPGQSIGLTVTALEKEITGTVRSLVPVADQASKTFRIKIDVAYMDNMIQNMSVSAYIPVGKKASLKMIRRDALIRNQGKEFVYTVAEDRAKILPVTVVAYEGEFVGVTDPYITPGMSIVVDGNERLRPDQPVTVQAKKE